MKIGHAEGADERLVFEMREAGDLSEESAF
jgi:hypothetical protein